VRSENRTPTETTTTPHVVRISAYTNQSRVSHSVRMRENGAEVYPKQSSLERSFELVKELLLEECTS